MQTHLKTLFAQFLTQATPEQLTCELSASKSTIAEDEAELKTTENDEEIEEIRESLAYEREVLAMVVKAIVAAPINDKCLHVYTFTDVCKLCNSIDPKLI